MARYGPPHIARENLRSNSEKHQKPRFRDFEEKKIKNVLKNASKVVETKPTEQSLAVQTNNHSPRLEMALGSLG